MRNHGVQNRLPKCNHNAFRQTLCSIDTYNPPLSGERSLKKSLSKEQKPSTAKDATVDKEAEDSKTEHRSLYSVLKLEAAQLDATSEAREHRQRIVESKWTQLSKLDALISQREKEDRRNRSRWSRDQQRRILDEQLKEKREEQEKASREREEEKALINASVLNDEKRRKDLDTKLRLKNGNLKTTILSEIKRTERKRRAKEETMKREEQLELDRVAAELSAEQSREFNRRQTKIEEMAKNRQENNQRNAEKRQKAKNEAEQDAKQMQEMLHYLEDQEKKREQALIAFQSKIEARLKAVGDVVVAEANQREAEETARLQKYHDEQDAKLQRAEQEKAEQRKKNRDHLIRCLDKQRNEREAAKQKMIADSQRDAAEVVNQVTKMELKEAAEQNERLKRNAQYKDDLLKQIENDRRMRIEAGVDMDQQEKLLNRKLLSSEMLRVSNDKE